MSVRAAPLLSFARAARLVRRCTLHALICVFCTMRRFVFFCTIRGWRRSTVALCLRDVFVFVIIVLFFYVPCADGDDRWWLGAAPVPLPVPPASSPVVCVRERERVSE